MRGDSLDELTCAGELHGRNLTPGQHDLQARRVGAGTLAARHAVGHKRRLHVPFAEKCFQALQRRKLGRRADPLKRELPAARLPANVIAALPRPPAGAWTYVPVSVAFNVTTPAGAWRLSGWAYTGATTPATAPVIATATVAIVMPGCSPLTWFRERGKLVRRRCREPFAALTSSDDRDHGGPTAVAPALSFASAVRSRRRDRPLGRHDLVRISNGNASRRSQPRVLFQIKLGQLGSLRLKKQYRTS